jgi:lysyl-tRNA synthetase class 1
MSAPASTLAAGSAWPHREAGKLLARLDRAPDKPAVVFQTGYGPSGLPHIGTFGEVVRTSMVRQAFAARSNVPTRLVAFSDDLDGLRKVPDNVPNPELMQPHLGKALTSIPDPSGKYESYGHHNNAVFRRFLDDLGVSYEFRSATDCYRSGDFDAALLRVLACHDDVLGIVLPTLREQRRGTYSPFLPIDSETGQVLQVPVVERDVDAGTIVYRTEDGRMVETPVTGGRCKLQWKADWAMRWAAFGVDYEMSGKDLIDSVRLSSRICSKIGGTPPETFIYELFLDEHGHKISKSRGNGLSLEQWLSYGTRESLKLFMYHAPHKAKRLTFDGIPRAMDDHLGFLAAYPGQQPTDRPNNPAWFIHGGEPPADEVPVTFGMLLNLAGVANAPDRSVLWGFVARYAPDASPDRNPQLDAMVDLALAFYRDRVVPGRRRRLPAPHECEAMRALVSELEGLPDGAEAEAIQAKVYAVGRDQGYDNLREWFQALYEVLFGESRGPRMGSFIELYGVAESIALLRRGLAGDLVAAA